MQGLKNPAGFCKNSAFFLTLTIFFIMMAYIFLVIIIYVCSLMSVFMYFSGYKSFAQLER